MRRLAFLALALVLALLWLAAPAGVPDAWAFRERDGDVIRPSAPERKSIFDIFRVKPKRERRPLPQGPKIITRPSGSEDFSLPSLAKDPDAKTVVIFGDFLAEMLGRGLEEAFGDTPAIRIVVHTQETAGLASGDIAALTRDIAETAEKEKMDFAVLMIGANDQRKIKAGDTTFEFRGEGWEDAYKTRIAAVTQALRATGKQTYVVGMPPVADADMNGAFAYFNELFREATFAASARFVDIWTVFLDADGQFTRNGPDIEGNEKQLRWRDGIRFTHAGRRKLAHYVEREIRRDAGLVRGMAALIDGGAAAAPSLYTGPWADRPAIGPVLSLTNPQVILGAPLLGDGNQQEPRDDTPQYHFVVLGEPLQAPVGRVDDFAWPPHQGIEPPAAATPEAPGTPDSAAPDNDAAADVPANGATPATAAVAEKPAEPLADIPIIIDPVPAR